jgi:hypothetical protein
MRACTQNGGAAGINVDELVFGVPNFRIVNAAFTYAHPQGSRFNDGRRGAWYCAFDADALSFHKAVEYAEINRFDDSVQYQCMLADFTATFHDIRNQPRYSTSLAPDSYIASQTLAERLLDGGSLGIIYPSVRREGGINLACFRPALVGNVRKGPVYRLTGGVAQYRR